MGKACCEKSTLLVKYSGRGVNENLLIWGGIKVNHVDGFPHVYERLRWNYAV